MAADAAAEDDQFGVQHGGDAGEGVADVVHLAGHRQACGFGLRAALPTDALLALAASVTVTPAAEVGQG